VRDILADLREVIAADQAPLPPAAREMAGAISARHGAAVRALIFYGSARRAEAGGDRMLDFYVLVARYRDVYGPVLAALAAVLPPNVHVLKIAGAEGRPLRCKYAVMTVGAFCRRAGGGSFGPMLWARFAQPATIVTEDAALGARLTDTFARACRRLAAETAPLVPGPADPGAPWVRGLAESYRTELRPERPVPRAREIVARHPERYARLSAILFPAGRDGRPHLPDPGGLARLRCRARWALRRVLGKPLGALRVLKAAATFDGGLDYLVDKVADHSGVRVTFPEHVRRHPVLFAPVIAWRLHRAGGFR
jgi:hypothetical protein